MNTESYWQCSASLREFPSLTSDLEVDVAIIGGGLTGITATWLLKRSGPAEAPLEQLPLPASRQQGVGGE